MRLSPDHQPDRRLAKLDPFSDDEELGRALYAALVDEHEPPEAKEDSRALNVGRELSRTVRSFERYAARPAP